jgi:nitroimidazol reductase NimA-like FMN-containing flavoprotein (pyridoxamine 5'-phosphate oxidase superfamily)
MTKHEFIESKDEMEALLRQEVLGYLGLAGEGQPYVVPLNYAYAEGKILFHCALEGTKLDHIRANPRVCFTVARQTGRVREHAGQDPCHVDSDSVICTGRARVVERAEERKALLDVFNRRYNPDAEPISQERAENCGAVEITIEEMTGRRERERGVTYWRYRFV